MWPTIFFLFFHCVLMDHLIQVNMEKAIQQNKTNNKNKRIKGRKQKTKIKKKENKHTQKNKQK